ncbi:MAG: hypothetical protein ACFBSF_11755 [Leptolyngbyaceae cyanobacterium]
MNSYSKPSNVILLDLQRQRLEATLSHSTQTAYRPGRIRELFTWLGTSIVNWLTTGSQPKVSKHVQGDAEFWRVYDPISKHALQFDNEDMLRTWMEQRYYR